MQTSNRATRCESELVRTGIPGRRTARPGPRLRRLGERIAPLLFAAAVALPLIRRLRHPTILGDDVTRLVDLIEQPVRNLIFLPFAEHVAPLFQLVSWVTWEAIGHDLKLAPLAFCLAAILAWSLTLCLLFIWLLRETGSQTATFIAVALVTQSPLVRETSWWYSSSSFSWAVSGILIALLGAGELARRRSGLALIGIGAALAPAGTTLGILAAPLAILRVILQPGLSRRLKISAAVFAIGGFLAYVQLCSWGETGAARSARVQGLSKLEPWAGLGYALSVPGRLLWPSTLGLPASWLAGPQAPLLVWTAGIFALCATCLLAKRASSGKRMLVLVGAAMIYVGYLVTYVPRVCMIRFGGWSEFEFLFQFAGRYHVLPLVGLAAILSTTIAGWPLIRRCDSRQGRPALAGAVLAFVMLGVQIRPASFWDFYLQQPDQQATFAALDRLGRLAREEGISRSQLVRIIDPAKRPWNDSVLGDRPAAFPLVKLAAFAPTHVSHPQSDAEALDRLKDRLTAGERVALGAGTCSSLNPPQPDADARIVAVARQDEAHCREVRPGVYRHGDGDGFIRFEFEPAPEARYLVLPGLRADQDVFILWCDQAGRWRPGQSVRWLKSAAKGAPAVIDLDRLIHLSARPLSRIALQFTGPGGEIELEGPPRLLR